MGSVVERDGGRIVKVRPNPVCQVVDRLTDQVSIRQTAPGKDFAGARLKSDVVGMLPLRGGAVAHAIDSAGLKELLLRQTATSTLRWPDVRRCDSSMDSQSEVGE